MRPPKIDVPTAPVTVEVQKVPGQPWIGGDLARRFWLPVAGPSLFLFTAAMSELDGQTVDVLDVARTVGIGRKTLSRVLQRAQRFQAVTISGSTAFVRGTWFRLSPAEVERLPASIADDYRAWQDSAVTS